jgi:hypothetical protein
LFATACLAFASACGGSLSSANKTDVHIGGVTIHAEIARTVEERAQGLGGLDSLPPDAGMLFVESDDNIPAFWMHGMRLPLDFIWISRDLRVVDVTENVEVNEHTTTVADISPAVSVLYVLEVNAGFIERERVQEGDAVSFEPDVAMR